MTPIVELICCPKCLGKLDINSDIMKCINCGSDFRIFDGKFYFINQVNDQIIPKKSKDVTNPKNWSELRKKNFEFFRNNLKPLLNKNTVVLDLGAGQGYFNKMFRDTNYIAADFYPYANINIVTDLNDRLPFQSETVDFVVMSSVLEHLKKPNHILCECFRIMKPNGKIFVTVPFIIKVHQKPFDYLRYTNFMLEYLFRDVGFIEVKIEEMGNAFDIYRLLTKGYFKIARRSVSTQKLIIKLLSRIFIKFLQLINTYSLLLIRHFIKIIKKGHLLEVEKDYVQGYGLMAKRPPTDL